MSLFVCLPADIAAGSFDELLLDWMPVTLVITLITRTVALRRPVTTATRMF